MRTFRIALAQINTTVGDLDGNTAKIIDYLEKARELQADLVAFPELAITGYPPEDLLFKHQFIEDNKARMRQVVAASKGITSIVGFVDSDSDVHNSAAVAHDGELVGVYHKMSLPNYGVFDEERYFKAGTECPVFVVNGIRVGVNVCEDIWRAVGPTVVQRSAGAEIIVNISASPFYSGKSRWRENMLATRATDNELYVAYLNLIGGQDELVFDGASIVYDPLGEVVARGSQFEEDLIVADLDLDAVFRARARDTRSRKESAGLLNQVGSSRTFVVSDDISVSKLPLPARQPKRYNETGEVYAALVTGTRDYIRKSGFSKVLIALSGGIDSSIVAAVAVDALGPENVCGLSMPSRYSSEGSVLDARELAENLGIELKTAPIEDVFAASLDTLAPHFKGLEPNLAEENIQSRIRGILTMAMSNKFGWLVLTTGNKSEMAVGYATIYGDMAGGYAVIKDVPKTLVYELCHYRNTLDVKPVIPETVLTKPPSAELRLDQTDQDSLPPYHVLDPILKAYVEEDRSFVDIVAMGFDEQTVKDIVALVDRNEYKRRQAPPGIKITPRNFGRDRRMPIANRYRPF
jgi:NAD+ synthase (glutamine-hydrolysing)